MASKNTKALTAKLNKMTKAGDIKQLAKEIKTDHALAEQLWATGDVNPRLLATLIFDKKLLTQDVIDQLADDIAEHDKSDRLKIADWLLANQLMKSKPTAALIDTWADHRSPVLQRLYWYRQGRLRWTGTNTPGDSAELLDVIEAEIADAAPEVQWVMNFCAGWIGVHEPKLRKRCVKLGEKLGLYKDEMVAKNCTPSYLPEFIRIEVDKRA